jgi:sugar phosphate isomerase/epimerase
MCHEPKSDMSNTAMRIGNTHIGYCLNIYPGETADAISDHITRQCPEVKRAVCPNKEMGVGLWLPAKAVREFRRQPDKLKKQLANQGMYAFTINAFPFGDFHSRPVKEKVYLPDWSSTDRRDYSIDAAHILAKLLPEGVDGSISTVPVAYGKHCPPQARANLVAVAAALEKLESQTGRLIRLAIEPEPDCYLERMDEFIDFFEQLRLVNRSLVDRYLGICLDVCHSAMQFDDPVVALGRLNQAGICVPKIQVSAALEVENPVADDLSYLERFDDGIYFHQTRVRKQNGQLLEYADLPEALGDRPKGHWRIHFHVPLHFEAPGTNVHSTSTLMNELFFRQALQCTTHLETETYTYAVLPEKYQNANASVSDELRFVARAVRAAANADQGLQDSSS